MATEFGKLAERRRIPFPPPLALPDRGEPESVVLAGVRERVAEDPWTVETDFALTYAGPPHPIASRAARLAKGTVFVEWTEDMYPGANRLEKEAVSMVASLLGAHDGVGFITSGGTESNISAVRLARDLAGARRPQFILPTSGHFSFRLAAQLLGVEIVDLPVDRDLRPRLDLLPRLVTRDTIGLGCSAPEGSLGFLDPVEEMADFAQRRGLYLHVDAAFGGFILPFLRDLGRPIGPFDFSLPGVTSMSADGHKLGMMPLPTGFFMVRDRELLTRGIPSDVTMIHTITSTKNGQTAAAAWAVLRRLGRSGYRRTVRRAMRVMETLADGIERIEGLSLLARPRITVLSFTADGISIERLAQGLARRGWGTSYGRNHGVDLIRLSLNPYRDVFHAERFLGVLAELVAEARATQGERP